MTSRMKSLDLNQVQTTSLRRQPCRMSVEKTAQVPDPTKPLQEFYNTLPRSGAAAQMLAAAEVLTQAALAERDPVWLVDAGAIEAGISPLIVRLIQQGLVRAMVMTGTAALRDYELAVQGVTDEDPAPGLRDGLYGLARETGEGMNAIINEGVRRGFGLGECLGRGILDRQPRYYTRSILAACAARVVPCMVNVTLGADGFHRHPMADGMMLGKGSLKDLQIFAARLPAMSEGGVLVSLTRSVGLRDAFYHAFASARNLGETIQNFSTVRFGDESVSLSDLPGVIADFHVPGPLELTFPMFTGVIFSLVE